MKPRRKGRSEENGEDGRRYERIENKEEREFEGRKRKEGRRTR